MNKIFIKIGAMMYDTENYSFPLERVFRDAWTAGPNPEAGVISVDMEKARNIWRDKIRMARVAEFEKLDADYLRALETGANANEIIQRKRELRDATDDPRINSASTPEELKAVRPAGLKL